MAFRLHRFVVGLVSAERCTKPPSIPVSRPRGTKAIGKRYEKALAANLPHAKHGQWYSFWDTNGHGWCQTDLEYDVARGRVLIECKLTDTPTAVTQIHKLYKPIMEHVYGKTIFPIIVVRNLTKESNKDLVVDTLEAAIKLAREGHTPILHWLGKSPLV